MALNTERRITMLEAMAAEIRKETAAIRASTEDARKEYRSHQRFVLRVTAAMVIAVVLTFSGIGYNAFSVNRSLAELTIKVDRLDARMASVETDVAALTIGRQQILTALRNAGIIEVVPATQISQ